MGNTLRNSWYILLILVFATPVFLHAQVLITEIMYDLEGSDAKREWIEVFNGGNSEVVLTNFRLRENNVEHGITAERQKALAPQSYAIIADNAVQFVRDHPGFSGILCDSAFSLRNEGESIALVDAAGVVAEITYTDDAANGTGESWQRANAHDALAPGKPTPGAGIPAGGLVRATAQASPKKPAAREGVVASVGAPSIVGDAPIASSSEIVLPRAVGAWYEWLAPLILAGLGSGGIVIARTYQKREWEIVEDFGESG